jgi:hypothetical protein
MGPVGFEPFYKVGPIISIYSSNQEYTLYYGTIFYKKK